MKSLILFITCFISLIFVRISAQSSTDVNIFREEYVIKNRVNSELTTGNKISTVGFSLLRGKREWVSKKKVEILFSGLFNNSSFETASLRFAEHI